MCIRDRYWTSPWCDGRPGWHIECSVMSKKYLGEEIDIHAGGEDLIFPHHENEIAQSECCNDKIFARYWMHNAFLNIDNRKMSKSLGNFRTVREISEQYDLQDVYKRQGVGGDYIFLIDEAHNLVERGREMYSAAICKEDAVLARQKMKDLSLIHI